MGTSDSNPSAESRDPSPGKGSTKGGPCASTSESPLKMGSESTKVVAAPTQTSPGASSLTSHPGHLLTNISPEFRKKGKPTRFATISTGLNEISLFSVKRIPYLCVNENLRFRTFYRRITGSFKEKSRLW